MPVLPPNDPRFGAKPDEPFVSPFPSRDAQESPFFQKILRQVETLPNTPPEGLLAARQAEAWTRANRLLMFHRLTGPFAGGLRRDWLPDVLHLEEVQGVKVAGGLFANVQFPSSAKKDDLSRAALEAGLTIAQNILSAVPIVGNILSAAIGVARFIAGLFVRGSPEEIPLRVPWVEYSRDLDEDVVNHVLTEAMKGTDWTELYMPALDYTAGRGFSMERTRKGGPRRAFGVFTGGGEPDFRGGLGFMPGTERLTQIIQVATVSHQSHTRRDAVTDVGSFLPSVSQTLTGTWAMVTKVGNPDMYKVKAGELADAWEAYFGRFFADAFDQYNRFDLGTDGWSGKIFLSKALSPLVVIEPKNGDREFGVDISRLPGPFVRPGIFERRGDMTYLRPDQAYIGPALQALKRQQKAALARSLVCALVRPVQVRGRPAFAAFEDRSAPLSSGFATFGEELRAYCLEMRKKLLEHPARFELAAFGPTPAEARRLKRWAPDVEAVDPPYHDQLQPTLGSGSQFTSRPEPIDVERSPLESGAPKTRAPRGPEGGAVFSGPALRRDRPRPGAVVGGPRIPEDATDRPSVGRVVLPILAGLGAVGSVGLSVYLARRDGGRRESP